jgi:hypothetical protein
MLMVSGAVTYLQHPYPLFVAKDASVGYALQDISGQFI